MARVAFVLADLFEDSELEVPYDRIRDAGHDVTVVGMEKGEVTGKRGEDGSVPGQRRAAAQSVAT